MAPQRSTTADKNIVDRTRSSRNGELARALRETRNRLANSPGSPGFDREMLTLHGRATIGSATTIPLLAFAAAASGMIAGMGIPQIVTWAAATSIVYAVIALFARRTGRLAVREGALAGIRYRFLLGHCLAGLCWSWFVWADCQICQIDQFPVVKAVVLLLAMAVSAIFSFALSGALLCTFALPAVLFAAMSVRTGTPVDLVMAGLLLVALPFFAYVAGHLRRSAIMLLSFRTEKDGLIAELETANAISDEARRRAEEANLAKSRFLASMSHELRTPLNAILGFSEVMSQEVLGPLENETYRDYARDIHTSGKHLLELINEILDISRIEAGRYQLQAEPMQLAEVVEECCHLFELKARTKSIRLVQDYESSLPQLNADERAVRQITLNLLSNAVKFAPSGGEVRVQVGWTAGGGQYISVRDNGPGIPADEIPIVLSAFGQGSIAIKNAEQGTGLGLPIVQGLLRVHEGKFDIRSKLRGGTEAIAIFPATRVLKAHPTSPEPQRATA
ncbi:sensor histidine kinase [Mesorhizobium xinjiangense]|uniref:sensor histidine kinase n=1 Tax=Mesorhizobium xinjiangense TaxID=2678685 RepID=UPI0012ED4F36|nr:HAMP domain-containing sensor histidine kinase [Mesorhizobium xinjiangense]